MKNRYNSVEKELVTTARSNKSRILSSLSPETPEISWVLDILINEQPTSCTIPSIHTRHQLVNKHDHSANRMRQKRITDYRHKACWFSTSLVLNYNNFMLDFTRNMSSTIPQIWCTVYGIIFANVRSLVYGTLNWRWITSESV